MRIRWLLAAAAVLLVSAAVPVVAQMGGDEESRDQPTLEAVGPTGTGAEAGTCDAERYAEACEAQRALADPAGDFAALPIDWPGEPLMDEATQAPVDEAIEPPMDEPAEPDSSDPAAPTEPLAFEPVATAEPAAPAPGPGTRPGTRPGAPPLPGGGQAALAPIEGVQILTLESFPPEYVAHVQYGLPNGCAQPGGYDAQRMGDEVHVSVYYLRPADPQVICTMIYGIAEVNVPMGSDFVPGQSYRVVVNGTAHTFTAR